MGKILKATHQGELDLNGFKISCAVLEDGTRVLVNRSLANALGIKGGGAYWQKKKEQKGALLPEYISAKYLEPFINDELMIKLLQPINYINKQKIETEGISAELLPEICDVYVKANEKGASKNSPIISENAYKIILAFAKVGITALVDEVTGYQYERERDELQKILKAYISEELLPWQQKFPHEFYKQIFRLNKWNYTADNLRKKPGVVGKWTNKYVYDCLPDGILTELKKALPKDEQGNKKGHYHRLLTEDVGHPHLDKQLTMVITTMKLSNDWKDFEKKFKELHIESSKEDNKND